MGGIVIAFRISVLPAAFLEVNGRTLVQVFRSVLQRLLLLASASQYASDQLQDLIFGFPAPIILASFAQRTAQSKFKRVVQTVSYLPHSFPRWLCGIILDFFSSSGVVNQVIQMLGGQKILFMQDASSSAILLAPVSGRESATAPSSICQPWAVWMPRCMTQRPLTAAAAFGRVLHVTIPGILPTIVIMLILRVGSMAGRGLQKIILLYRNHL